MKPRNTTGPRLLALATLALSLHAGAAVVGINPPVLPLSRERIEQLAPDKRPTWLAYLQRSDTQRSADRAALAAERTPGMPVPPPPAGGSGNKSMPLDQPAAWYRSSAARAVADNIVSFQTPAGGWGKNQPRDQPPRQKGQAYVPGGGAIEARKADDFDLPKDVYWNWVGTIDNDATTLELQFLAKVVAQLPAEEAAPYRQSFMKGVGYLLAAQFPNGGWPQVWPLQGGYHDALTINDDAAVQVAELMGQIARGESDFAFVPPAVRAQAAECEGRAIAALLVAQVKSQGRALLWAQQYDALTMAPVSARNYEPPALSSFESANVLMYLMRLQNPSEPVRAAIQSGVAALRELAIYGQVWGKVDEAQGRRLTPQAGAGPLWSRYYDVQSLKPVFGDRDKTLHDTVDNISLERRNGYSWFSKHPEKALLAFEDWARRWGAGKQPP